MSDSPKEARKKSSVLRSFSRKISGKSKRVDSSSIASGSPVSDSISEVATQISLNSPGVTSTPVRNQSDAKLTPLQLKSSPSVTSSSIKRESVTEPQNASYPSDSKQTTSVSISERNSDPKTNLSSKRIDSNGSIAALAQKNSDSYRTTNTKLPDVDAQPGTIDGKNSESTGLERSSSSVTIALSDDEDWGDDYNASVSSFRMERHTNAHSAMLIEAVNDTPTFQASAKYLDIQIRQLDQWLKEFATKHGKIQQDIDRVKSSVNSVISHFMPSVTHHSMLAQDYTTLLFGRYTEAESLFWTDLFATVKSNTHNIQTMVSELHDGIFSSYYKALKEYKVAFKNMKSARDDLFKLPAVAISIAVRDANLKMWTFYKVMVRASTKLVIITSQLESEVSLKLLETLSSQFMGADKGFFNYDQTKLAISTELFRLKTFAAKMRESENALNMEMYRLRNEALGGIKNLGPPRAAKSYEVGALPDSTTAPAHKVGWVNVQVEGDEWKTYWAFIQNGLFGLLGVSSNGTSVMESARFVISRCQFEVITQDKQFNNLFRISFEDRSVVLQATNCIDLSQWQASFNQSKNLQIDKKQWKGSELYPWSKEFAIPVLGSNICSDSDTVKSKIKEITKDMANPQWIQYNSSLTAAGATAFASNVPAVKPMPTSVLRETVIANGYFKPYGIPNAITANFWGSIDHFSESSLLNPSAPDYDCNFPDYPPNYPHALIIQDMGMRAFCQQLSVEDRPASDDLVVLFFRCTTFMFGCEVPARVYATATKLFFYACWNGMVALQTSPVEKVLEISSSHGISSSELIIAFHAFKDENVTSAAGNSQSDANRRLIKFNLYIDSSALAERRLALILQNRRSRKPLSCEELIEPLGIINLEYAEALKSKEVDLESELVVRPKSKYMTGNVKESKSEYVPHSFGEWLFTKSVGNRNTLGEEDAYEFGKGMTSKFAQDTFPVNAETLFTVMFGPKSPVFQDKEAPGVENSVGQWVQNGRRLERRIANYFKNSNNENAEKRYNLQKLEHRERDLYVVTERRSSWEMPSGEQFYLVLKYVVYATGHGSHLQIWGKTIWTTKNVSKVTQKTVHELIKAVSQGLTVRLRDCVSTIENLDEALTKYGKVKAVKVVSRKHENYEEMNKATRVTPRYAAHLIVNSQLRYSCTNIKYISRLIFSCIGKVASPLLAVLLIVAAFSLYYNIKLYSKSSEGYWNARLEIDSVNKYIDEMQLLPQISGTFTRAIYTKDIDEILASGKGWVTNNTGRCSEKFSQIASLSLWSGEYGSLYEMESSAQSSIDRITSLRLDYAQKRSDMMALISVLNQNERNELNYEYQRWIVDESSMCTAVRPVLQTVDETVYDELYEYCISCLQEATKLI